MQPPLPSSSQPPPFAYPPGAFPPSSQPSWWQRNWKWFVPTGCFALLVLVVVFISLIFLGVSGAMKSSDAYKTAVARASADPRVTNALGTPLTTGTFTTGSINVSGSVGRADMAIPISGSQGKGTLYVVADKAAGQWKYSMLTVEVEKTGERIELNKR